MARLRQWNEVTFVNIIGNFESMGLSLRFLWHYFVDSLPPDKKLVA